MNTRATKVWLAAPLLLFAASLTSAESLQLLRNGGFEEDEMTLRGEPASSCGGYSNDQWFNQQDRFPDAWTWPGVLVPSSYGAARQSEWPKTEVTFDTAVHHGGNQSVRLSGKSAALQQGFEWNNLADLFRDVPNTKPALLVKDGLAQDMTLEGWVKTKDVPADAKVAVALNPGAGKFEVAVGTADWQRFEIKVPASAKAVAGAIDVQLTYVSPSGAGQVWFDDLALVAAERPEPNLLPNGSFESVATAAKAASPVGRGTEMNGAAALAEGTPYPEGWSQPRKWSYHPGPIYYIWNTWQHFYTEGRGTPRVDGMVARSGTHSLRFDLFGGDEYATQSPAIALNQGEARPIEVTAWVRADRVRQFDLMLVDEEGRRLPTNNLVNYWGGQTGGTYGWVAVRKVFQGFGPVKSVRLRIGARGFNGTTATDIGVWHAHNQVSTLWVDDVSVREIYSTPAELAARQVQVPAAAAPAGGVRVADIDLGERLFGENEVAASVKNETGASAKVALEVTLLTPSGKQLKTRKGDSATVGAGQEVRIAVPYEIAELSPSWRQPGTMKVALLVNGKQQNVETFGYGTWPVVVDVRPSKAFLDETENPILMAINLGVSKKTLAKISSLNVEVVDRRTGKAVSQQTIKDIPATIASSKLEDASKDRFYFYAPRAGLLDHRNLILQEVDISKLPAEPWDNPESRWAIRVTAKGADGVAGESHAFARLTKMNETLEPIKEVTIDPIGKFFRVNGKPFFLLAQSHANGAANGGAPPTRSVSFSPAVAKNNGLNGANRWGGTTAEKACWKDNVYLPMFMAGTHAFSGADMALANSLTPALASGQIMLATGFEDGKLQPLNLVSESPSALCYFTSMGEAIYEMGAKPEGFKAQEAYADAVRPKVNRPVATMDNHSQYYPWHDDDGFLDHFDALYMEREGGAVYRPELSLRNWMKRKEKWVMVDLPQTYENVPHERERYRTLVNVLHGGRGWFGIQGCADPSLYRGLGGELRYIFKYLSANEGTVEPAAPQGIIAKAWKKGDRVLVMAEQHNPIPRGKWTWETVEGKKAHTGESRHAVTPVKAGFAIHGYNDDTYREIRPGDVLRQEVFIPADRKPQAIFVVAPGNGDFNHVAYWGGFDHTDFKAKHVDAFLAGECYSAAAYGINWYRAAIDTWPAYQAAHRFPPSAFVKFGDAPPEAGKWVTLEVPLEKLNLTGRVVDGLMFMSSGGVAWWGKSTLVHADGKEEVLLDGRIGRDAANYRKTTFSLPGIAGLKSGTIRVVGENRTLKLDDGKWTDDLHGEDLYDCLNDGYLGDGITYGQPFDAMPEALELSYTYDNSPRCIRVYEVMPAK